jgi:hypothetical protein
MDYMLFNIFALVLFVLTQIQFALVSKCKVIREVKRRVTPISYIVQSPPIFLMPQLVYQIF